MSNELQRPTGDNRDEWKAYWTALGMPWRTEPEIAEERQRYLTKRREIVPDIEKGSYPFKDVKLNRADVEWLLATHESEGLRGPVDWSDERQRIRQGLDLRGADLRKAALQKMPLSRTIGGLFSLEKVFGPGEPLNMAAVHLEQADLNGLIWRVLYYLGRI